MSVKFINLTKKSFLKNSPLFKIISLDRVDSYLGDNPCLWFSNLEYWNDAFEKRFVEMKYKKGSKLLDYPLKNKIFCTCFSDQRICEAQWYVYSGNKSIADCIGLKINRIKLLEILEKYSIQHNNDVYIGKVEYQTTTEIISSVSKNSFLNKGKKKFDINDRNSQLRLLLLKRNAFIYEDEIRIFIIRNENQLDTASRGISMSCHCKANELVQEVIMNPQFAILDNLKKRLETPLGKATSSGKGFGFELIKDSMGKPHPRVVVSRLYDYQHSKYIEL